MDYLTLDLVFLRKPLFIVLFLSLTACGGGGGDGGQPGITYAGNSDPAIISTSNAARLVGNIFVGQALVETGSGGAFKNAESRDVSSGSIGLAQTPGRITMILRDVLQSSPKLASRKPNLQARTDVDETDLCDSNGGSIHITGFVEDDGTGLLTLDFINCRDGSDTLDGEITVQVNAFDFGLLIPTNAVYSFSLFTFKSSTFNVSLDGSMQSQVSIATRVEQLTVDRLVARNNASGEMLMINNQISIIEFDNILFPSAFFENVSGRIYDSIHGYVDFATLSSIVFNTITQEYPDGGHLVAAGSLNSSIQITVLSSTHTSLNLDLDGDLNFEVAYTLSWPEIDAETDLIDSDNDGMHDSWEQANGLDSNNPGDANIDVDSDGFDNLSEYSEGSDPNNPGSTPPIADLSITTTGNSNPIAGDIFVYTLSITNNGTAPAKDLVITDILPPEVSFLSVSSSSGWNCRETDGTVTCVRNSLDAGVTQSIRIFVTLPYTPGAISNTSTVTSTNDLDQGNNSASLITNVLPAIADLSITKRASSSAVVAGDNVTYHISILNIGPNTAGNVLVTDILPAEMTLVSATPSQGTQGSCIQSTTINCNLGVVLPSSIYSIDIVVTAPVEGSFNNTVTVTSSAEDSDTTNNSSTVTTLVGTSASSIQSLINAAIPGETIQVDPGIYIGSLDFASKDITLKANGEATKTIIHGNDSRVITIGPKGTIQGFTITGARESFGAGIEVSGSDTLITGNIFDGNVQTSGGYGAAIGGNSASPFIERNLFKNNSCDSQHLSGVLGFINNSSPVIVNNLFDGNPCRAINMTLPTENAAIVQNNTFIGNRVGIRMARGVNINAQTYRNNIIAQNEVGLEVDFGDELNNPVWENNLVFGNTINYQGIDDQSWMNGNIASDPLFIDSSSGNFQLQIGSPAIDTGNSFNAPAIDFDGTTRPFDGDGDTVPQVDMGAFEAPAL